jgi:trans-AT polyketide synthase/acyltransferase/oxidoreductase domain-containing protein
MWRPGNYPGKIEKNKKLTAMTNKPIVFMFSGQGSQYYHMGKALFQAEPCFREWMHRLDAVVEKISGVSVVAQLYHRDNRISDIFDRTRLTHPAIFMVEFALTRVLLERGIQPGVVLGSSLGEFAAAATAGIMDPEELLGLVVKQAEIFETYCPTGGMLTILHDPALYRETPLLFENSQLASINYASHFVVSGKNEGLRDIALFLKKHNIGFQLLPVSFAYHSSLIDAAAGPYLAHLDSKSFQPPSIPVISCMEGKLIDRVPPGYFWHIVRKPVVLPQALENFGPPPDTIFLDLGPAGTMANLVKNNLNHHPHCFTFMTPFGGELKKLGELDAFLAEISYPDKTNKEEKKMKVYLFPGQGAQRKGMGQHLFDEFAELTQKADEILGYSIKELCLEDPGGRLVQTQFTQPAVYVVNALSYFKKIQTEPKPDYVLGHSVGEYNALLASGVVDFEQGLKLVKKRGELMSEASGGGMAAVMGLVEDKVEEILKENHLEHLYIANCNSPRQIVISGLKAEIVEAEAIFLAKGATHYRVLNVSGAFHTPYMVESRDKFENYVKKFKFSDLAIPVISNATARPYRQEDIVKNMVEQITTPVNWTESIRYLLAKGIDIEDFDEIGVEGLSVVKALAIRTNHEAGPLDLALLEAGETQESKEIIPGEKEPEQVSTPVFHAFTADSLGSSEFKKEYRLKYAYLTGGMYKGIASRDLVVRMGKSGLMGFFGSGGLELHQVEAAIQEIQAQLGDGQLYGMNLVANPTDLEPEEKLVDLYMRYGITRIEAAAYMQVTPALVRYRARGLSGDSSQTATCTHKIIAKVSRPEVAEQFLSPAPERIVKKLLEAGKITQQEADFLGKMPMADALCVEADSGGHTDQGMPYALMPAMTKLRDEMVSKHGYSQRVYVGAAGGIGTPEAAAAAFILGADFILTGSINQCSVEAGTSDPVKDMLQDINVQDTDYAPAGDMFEMGAKVQVLKKGVFFPARANKLYDLYRFHNSLEEIDEKTRTQLQERYFKRSFEEIYQDVRDFYPPEEIERAERNPKYKMALTFKWYFGYTTRLALEGNTEQKVDFQVHCGPALGAFNQWVKGTPLENWRNRHVDEMAEKLMKETADVLNRRFYALTNR